MNDWPPNPGLTVMMSSRSRSSTTSSTTRERRRGHEREAGPHSLLADLRQVALHVDGGLGVEGEDAGPEVGVLLDVALRLHHHQVHVERRVGEPSQRLEQRGPEREVGDEPSVHHVDVEPLGAAGQHDLDLLPQAAEVGAEQTGSDANRHC